MGDTLHRWSINGNVLTYTTADPGQSPLVLHEVEPLAWTADGGEDVAAAAPGVTVHIKHNFGCVGPVEVRADREDLPSPRFPICFNEDYDRSFHRVCMRNLLCASAPDTEDGCTGRPVWSRSPQMACCKFPAPCAVPDEWPQFESEEACEASVPYGMENVGRRNAP